MKYSVGITNSKRKSASVKRKPAKKTGLKALSPTGLNKYKNFKKYSSKNIGKNKKNLKKGKNKKGAKVNSDFKIKAKKVLYVSIGVVFFLGCVAMIVGGIYLKGLQNSLPAPDELVERTSDQSTQIFDRNGELLYTVYGDQNREFVSIDEIPEYTKWALLSAEDIEFYQHKGLDYVGIATATLQNFKAGGVVRGASTLTQQLVKTTILYDILGDEAYQQSYLRKIKEALITMQVEQTFSKDEILQMYMNEVPLGGVNYGFQAAANAYFDKDVSELDLAESALIAGLIQSPGIYSPLYGTNPDMAKVRQNYVLDQMWKNRDKTGVTEEEIEEARNEELTYRTGKIDITAPHFVFYVKQQLEEEYGVDRVERGGLKVTTSLDSSIQEIAEEETIKGVDKAKGHNVNNGAMVVLDPNNGEVLAMVGSVDYWNNEDPRVDGNVNITVSPRQMGSSVKPFVYYTAINKGYGPWLETPDLKDMKFGGYDPNNWDKENWGLMTAREALVFSRNVPAVYTLQLIGIDSYLQTMQKFGVTTLADKSAYGLSLALGSGEEKLLEHAGAFSVLANGGIKHDITSVLKIEDSNGEVVFEAEEAKGTRVADEKEIYAVNWMLCDLGGFGARAGAKYYTVNGKKVCGKTGTTDGPKDLVTVLYHSNLVVAVWNGNNNNKEMPGAWATTVPLPTANSFMGRVMDIYKPETYNRPSGVLATTVCKDTGATPSKGVDCEKEASIYISGHAPQVDKRTSISVCTKEQTIPSNLSAAEKYGLIETKVVLSTKLENSFHQAAYEKYLKGLDDSVYLLSTPETGACALPLGPNNAPLIDMTAPVSGSSVKRNSNLEISGQVSYLESISTFTVKFDGVAIAGATLGSSGAFVVNYFVPDTTTIGAHTVTVTAVDNFGKSDTESVAITVTNSSTITVSLASPADEANIAFPVNLVGLVAGGTADSVTFTVSKLGGGYTQSFVDSDGSNGWSYNWNDNSGGNGDYRISISATKDGSTVSGDSVEVTY